MGSFAGENIDQTEGLSNPEIGRYVKAGINLRILDNAEEMRAVEALQRYVWPDNETDVVPVHMLITAAHNGGLVIGAYLSAGSEQPGGEEGRSIEIPEERFTLSGEVELIGFVFGFPGTYPTPDGPRLKHCSHMLGVHPKLRDAGIGFALKRAQWQMVRHQGIDRITWTFDPLLSRNAFLNIARLGAVCNTYLSELYGTMLDGLNAGLPSDRLQVDWWINSQRVNLHLSNRPRSQLDLAHYLAAGAQILNPSRLDEVGLIIPTSLDDQALAAERPSLALLEIPADFMMLKSQDIGLAMHWRLHIRKALQECFGQGFVITDFVHMPGKNGRSFYVLSNGELTL